MNVLLVTDIPPCRNYTAGLVLDDMCEFLLDAGHNVDCFCVKHKSVDAEIPENKRARMRFHMLEKPRENWGRSFPGRLSSLLGNNYTAYAALPKIAAAAARFARECGSDIIWSAVQGQTIIAITRPAALKAGIPYVTQIWDPPEWWLMENRFDSLTSARVMREFAAMLRHGKCCITASWAMAEEYTKLYHCPLAIPVIRGFELGRVLPSERKDDAYVIALSGQIYATREFSALLKALDGLDWMFNTRKIVLRLYGRYFQLAFSKSARVELRGWMGQDALLGELAEADILYCPYWFGKQYDLPCRLSFPSKLSTYLKTARPVLMHGPEYSSPNIFIKEHNAGYICDSPKETALAECITAILLDPERDEAGLRGYQAFSSQLTCDHMKKNFFTALGIS